MAENHELEALDQLVNSDGWKLFAGMVDKQWGPSSEWFLGELDKALSHDDRSGTEHFRQVRASQREIQRLMQMVPQRIKTLKDASVRSSGDFVGSRRGPL